MGNILCATDEQKKAALRNNEIELRISADRKSTQFATKVLLLGSPESGKSTVFKQMKLLHSGGIPLSVLMEYKRLVFKTVVMSMKQMIEVTLDRKISTHALAGNKPASFGGLKWRLDSFQRDVEKFKSLTEKMIDKDAFEMDSKLAELILQMWLSREIQETYERSDILNLQDSAKYFFDNLDRIVLTNFIPTQHDVIYCGFQLKPISELVFVNGDTKIKLIDVGGQKSQRRKWITLFNDVGAIIFVVALSSYCRRAADTGENLMVHSLRTFNEIANNKLFLHTPIFLFLNKFDIFKQQLNNTPLNVAFPDYRGRNTFKETIKYIKQQFKLLVPEGKPVPAYVTVAIDMHSIRPVFNFCIEALNTGNSEKEIAAKTAGEVELAANVIVEAVVLAEGKV